MPRLKDKVAIVTGAGGGVGRAAALAFAAAGARVMVTDLHLDAAAETAEAIGLSGGVGRALRVDVAATADVERMVAETIGAFGRLDIAFNNAGTPGRYTTVVDCTEEEWDQACAVNLKSVWLCMKFELPAMIAGGGGAIVNMASEAAMTAQPSMVSYAATKAGVVALTRSAALDYEPKGVRVNVLLPDPASIAPTPAEPCDAAAQWLHLEQVGRQENLAGVACWLCSDDASFVTGVGVSAGGGLSRL